MKKFARLTYNANGYQKPSGHPWKKSNQGKKNISYENQYGYGHEEWLFNPNFQKDGYQYGFVRGLTLDKTSFFEEVHLYTVKKERGKNLVFYLGYINNVEGIINNEEIQEEVAPSVYDPYFKEMLAEIEEINGDTSRLLEKKYYEPSVRFKVTDKHLETEPVLLPNFDLGRYKRFMAYDLTENFLDQVAKTKKRSTGFKAGKAKQSIEYGRTAVGRTTTVTKLHSEITKSLEKYLKPKYSISKKNISIEMTRFDNCIGDVVTFLPSKKIDIYEIKTTSNARKNIREALAQLLDYSVHSKEKVNQLIIVSPARLDKSNKKMLKKLNKLIDYPIAYLYYDFESKSIVEQ